jgi:hypothetical protein
MRPIRSKILQLVLLGILLFGWVSTPGLNAKTALGEQNQLAETEPEIGTPPLAFVHVNVIPMDGEEVLTDQTALIHSGRITGLGPSDTTSIPEGATLIEGSGLFLLPGLTDAHVHLSSELAGERSIGL